MPHSQLKRAEQAIASIRKQGGLSPGTADALDEIVGAIRVIERRLAALEDGPPKPPTTQMELPNKGR